MSKQVTIHNTRGNVTQTLNTNAADWATLKTELQRNNIDTKGYSATIGESQLTLQSDYAEIPQTDFTLFLMAEKVVSGLCL